MDTPSRFEILSVSKIILSMQDRETLSQKRKHKMHNWVLHRRLFREGKQAFLNDFVVVKLNGILFNFSEIS